MNTCKQITVIETTLTLRGHGLDSSSPMRRITEYWKPDGTRLAEIDPVANPMTPEKLLAVQVELGLHLKEKPLAVEDVMAVLDRIIVGRQGHRLGLFGPV